jgi:hypothetical protein
VPSTSGAAKDGCSQTASFSFFATRPAWAALELAAIAETLLLHRNEIAGVAVGLNVGVPTST